MYHGAITSRPRSNIGRHLLCTGRRSTSHPPKKVHNVFKDIITFKDRYITIVIRQVLGLLTYKAKFLCLIPSGNNQRYGEIWVSLFIGLCQHALDKFILVGLYRIIIFVRWEMEGHKHDLGKNGENDDAHIGGF